MCDSELSALVSATVAEEEAEAAYESALAAYENCLNGGGGMIPVQTLLKHFESLHAKGKLSDREWLLMKKFVEKHRGGK